MFVFRELMSWLRFLTGEHLPATRSSGERTSSCVSGALARKPGSSRMNATTGTNSLHGREFLVVGGPSLVSVSMVLNEIDDYLSLTGTRPSGFGCSRSPDVSSEQRKFYKEYVDRRRLHMRHSEQEAYLPSNIRGLYNQLTEGLEGTGTVGTIEKSFHPQRDAILRELTTIGLTKAGWHYVVDNLPTDAGQLRGTLLVIMPEKLKSEWADQTQQKIKRIVELSHRLKFLMRLSEADPAERKQFFTEDLPSLPVRKKSISPQRAATSTASKPPPKPPSPVRKNVSPPTEPSISFAESDVSMPSASSDTPVETPVTASIASNLSTPKKASPAELSSPPKASPTIDFNALEAEAIETQPEPSLESHDPAVVAQEEPPGKKRRGRPPAAKTAQAPKPKAAPKPPVEPTSATRKTSRSTAGRRKN